MKLSQGPGSKVVLALVGLLQIFGAQGQPWSGGELPLVEPPPTNGTFFLLSRFGTNGFGRTFDSNPFALFGAPVYGLGSNYFEVDDSGVNYAEVHELVRTNAASRTELLGLYMVHSLREKQAQMATNGGGEEMELMSGGHYSMESEEEEGGEFGPMGASYTSSTNGELYLEVTDRSRVTNGWIGVTLRNTTPGLAYDMLFRLSLTNGAEWAPDQLVVGAEESTDTFTWVSMEGRTNQLFLRARSYLDSDGDGLPDWWELKYGLNPNSPDTGGTGVVDGEKELAGDGWTTIYKYEHGINPTNWITPPPPRNVQAKLDASGTNVVIMWESGGGVVSNYTVESSLYVQTFGPIGAGTFTYTDSPGVPLVGEGDWVISYAVRAHFANGGHVDSAKVTVPDASLRADATIARGAGGRMFLVVGNLASNVTQVRVFADDGFRLYPGFDVPVTNLVNGVYALNDDQIELLMPSTFWSIQPSLANGAPGGVTQVGPWLDSWYYRRDHLAFRDASRALKENLKFLLRAATVNHSFSYISDQHPDGTSLGGFDADFVNHPDGALARGEVGTNYEYSGFHIFNPSLNYSITDELRPVQENFIFSNFVFNAQDGGSASADSYDSCGFSSYIRTVADPLYLYTGSGNQSNLPVSLMASNAGWIFSGYFQNTVYGADDCANAEVAVSAVNQTNLVLSSGARNCYGLAINSVRAWTDDDYVLYPGVVTGFPYDPIGYYYTGIEMPVLQPVGYYFVSQTPYRRFGAHGGPGYTLLTPPPIPGSPSFSGTNNPQVLIAPIGEPYSVSGWAKMSISNGYAGKYAYLEQYFDTALKIEANGDATNETGVLSPYGEFFPTEPGPTALRTMPDIDTGQRGTGVVNVIKLQLDVNHDGTNNLSFSGPDNTSPDRPYVFWVNDDFDRWHKVGPDREQDDLASTDWDAHAPMTTLRPPDCKYPNGPAYRLIPCPRDLEDFARLWITGVTSNLLTSLPPGTMGELSWGDKNNPNPSNPTIDLFVAAEPNGGMGYLTNYWAITQTNGIDYPCIGTIGPGESVTVFSNNWMRPLNLIWCGVKAGTGALTLTIRQGTNILAETSAYIQLTDIKQMYERWTVGDAGGVAPLSKPKLATDGLAAGAAFKYTPSTETNKSYILLVHDYDLPPWKKDRYAETAFKRLYWQGYQGRFGLFRWPNVFNLAVNPRDDSEFNAWRSGAGLLNLLTNLNAQYPSKVYLMAHGYGAIAAGEALRLAGTNQIVNRYIAMQGAVASHSYVTSAPVRLLAVGKDNVTPNRYAAYSTNASGTPLCYFDGVGGAGIYINYFNTNDYVLTNLWRSDQDAKPAVGLTYAYHWDGTNFSKGLFSPSPLVIPTNTYEIFSYCDEARCEAIGAQPFLGGPFDVSRQVDLDGSFSFGGTLRWHSMQFLSDCAYTWDFWRAVLQSFGIPP